jgi:hypothetical protein
LSALAVAARAGSAAVVRCSPAAPNRPHQRIEPARGQPGVPGEEGLGDARRGQEHHGQHHAVEDQAEVDRLHPAQDQAEARAVAQLGQLGVGEHAGAPPRRAEHEAEEEEAQRVDPQAPEREQPGGGDHPGDEERRVGGELGRRHAEPGRPAREAPPGEEVLLGPGAGALALTQAAQRGPDQEGAQEQEVDEAQHPLQP